MAAIEVGDLRHKVKHMTAIRIVESRAGVKRTETLNVPNYMLRDLLKKLAVRVHDLPVTELTRVDHEQEQGRR